MNGWVVLWLVAFALDAVLMAVLPGDPIPFFAALIHLGAAIMAWRNT